MRYAASTGKGLISYPTRAKEEGSIRKGPRILKCTKPEGLQPRASLRPPGSAAADLENKPAWPDLWWNSTLPCVAGCFGDQQGSPLHGKRRAQVNDWPCQGPIRLFLCVPALLFYVNHPEHVCINFPMMHL